MTRQYLLFNFFLLLFPCGLVAQNISGKIVNEAKETIIGAYITVGSSELHTHSDELGKFWLEGTALGDTLKITHIGYETQLYIISDLSQELTIKLSESFFDLGEVVVEQNARKVNIISAIDIATTPAWSSQDMLRKVPGLLIGQHAGGGKAEQIFLRGFDIDHGTDVNITVDGMPVNMVSHAHGQGYADMHFVIPETINLMNFGKGPYYADKGNFTTAGYIEFTTKEKLENSLLHLEAGRFNSLRTVGLFKLLDTEKHNAYIAGEYSLSDGPFESSQNFSRNNLLVKYTSELPNNGKLSLQASHFSSRWDASGQIPQRAVDQGLIRRFGAIDDTEGGQTSRTNIALNFNKALTSSTFIKNKFYYSLYDFELFSNFTFFLNDPDNGDQIKQREKRQIFGLESTWNHSLYLEEVNTFLKAGVGFRSDQIKENELSRTLNRRTNIRPIQIGDVYEQNLYTFAKAEFDIHQWLIEAVLRYDYFKFNYIDELNTLYKNQSQSKGILSPKLNITYTINQNTQLFLKSGRGFHSNDARVVLDRDSRAILPAAYGVDLGTIFKPSRRIFMNVALWYLYLEQEFVYVGDEGVVEPSGSTRRVGVDVGVRWQLNDWLYFTTDVNYAFARSLESAENEDYIPLAPPLTMTNSLSWNKDKFHGALQFRYLQDRPANEDNSIIAEGYYITDLNMNYDVQKNINIGFAIENLFNQEWNETQFATASRLRDELEAVEEIHFTPGAPFSIRGFVKYKF